MFELKRIELPAKSGVQLSLYRYTDSADETAPCSRKPVLLLHGASASHLTFTIPDGGLVKHLARNFDPWLLNWRGSGTVVDDRSNDKSLSEHGDRYNFNLAAREDVPYVVDRIRHLTNQPTVGAVGFCMGSAILAEAVGLGHVSDADVDCIVLMTLGLFYETAIDGRLKSEDRVLERLMCRGEGEPLVKSVDPRVAESQGDLRTPWPIELDAMYKGWPGALKSHADDRDNSAGRVPVKLNPVKHMCNRLSFMYGMPYHHGNLSDEVHGVLSVPLVPPELPQMFGGIPLHMYIHGARNIRQGQATHYRQPSRLCREFVSDEARERFRRLSKVTLITGALNRLWHRDSIDLMHEWLTRGNPQYLQKFTKNIFPTYGHQDLLWGKNSATEVYPIVCSGLAVGTASATS
jgi:cholesterol oxidase